MTSDVRKKIAIGAGWMVLLRWSDRLIGVLSIVVLARLLLPVDFGLVAYAMVFVAILELFFMFGFDTVLIRDQQADDSTYNTAWTLEIIKGLLLALLLLIGAKPIAEFFSEPRVENIVYVISIVPVLTGLKNVGVINFQKELTLHKEFYFQFSARVISTTCTITIAVVTRSYWALVVGAIILAAAQTILSYVMSSYRPKLTLSRVSEIFDFSKWLMLQNLVSGLNERMPAVAVGRFLDAQALAYFNIGMQLAYMASQELAAPIRRALFPGLAKIQNDASQIANTVVNITSVIVLVGLPMTIGIAVVAPLLVPVLLGNNWVDLVPILQVLCLHGVTWVLHSSSHMVYYAIGVPKITALLSVVRFVVLLPLVYLLVINHGTIGVAWALVASDLLVLVIIDYIVLHRVANISIMQFVPYVWRSMLGCVAMASSVYFVVQLQQDAPAPLELIAHLLLAVASGMIVYVASVWGLWLLSGRPNGPEDYVLRMLNKLRHKRLVESR